jgi:hypothetical protein
VQTQFGDSVKGAIEGNMAKTAVGLFEDAGSADGVVRDLTAQGFLQKDIRVLDEPVEIPGSGLMSTPHTDFEVELIRDLPAFGIVEGDAEAYVQGVRRGGVMAFATSLGEKADKAAAIMNRRGALEVEQISAQPPALPNAETEEEIPVRGLSKQLGGERSPSSGARLFVW